MSGHPANKWRAAAVLAADILCGAWLVGGSLFFFLRFSMTFYAENKAAVDSILDGLFPAQR
ncbi:MAG TPA: hypothetical protein PKO36_17005 [Candidatus Hydrogenedentes bacterium]|nr:hypothetical protein [Candidatus Hydrogenedentota bacterium]HOT49703.1 hypothetical protein [Candidatus Hydrogenedentota bacterium]HOV73668.1 hypothetical protein [Candidatus Hydrogenedentota bacterium]HPC16288.1 hypothetical protein [Candidatus Hydrogenedentota bacterium]HRT20794.1 hypothetical protein [Candidatus Hydrogenedentota bacterium]